MKIGIRAHDLGMKKSAAEMAASIREAGFNSVQLVLHKGLEKARHEAGDLDSEYAEAIGRAFSSEGIEIALLGAYYNWFDDKGNRGFEKFREHLKHASDFGTSIVGTEVQGPSGKRWEPNPENESEEAFAHVVSTAEKLTELAELCGTYVGLEGAASHVLSTPEKVSRLCREVGSDRISLIFDLYNFLTLENYRDQRALIDRTIELYGDRLKVVHCKDFLLGENELRQVPPGSGELDYPYLISRLKETGRDDITLIFEEVTGDDILGSLAYIRGLVDNS